METRPPQNLIEAQAMIMAQVRLAQEGPIPSPVKDIQSMADFFVGFAKEMLFTDGQVHPTIFFIKEKTMVCWPVHWFFQNDLTKDLLGPAAQLMCGMHEAKATCFISEAWTVCDLTKDECDPETETTVIPPSQHPRRVECIMVNAEWEGGLATLRMRKFDRDEDDNPVFRELSEEEKKLEQASDTACRGRMAGFLTTREELENMAKESDEARKKHEEAHAEAMAENIGKSIDDVLSELEGAGDHENDTA